MTSTAIAAARLLREYAEELKRSHTIFISGAWPEGESEAKAAYEQHIAIASALEAMPAKCLHQIQEPTPVTAMDALREAEAALEVAMARILKADPSHSICVTSEAKALVAVRAALAATPAADAPAQTIERQRMTAGRASFFMERFLREEKLLGPNEQAALHFVIDMLEAAAAPVVLPEPVATLEVTESADTLLLVRPCRVNTSGLHKLYTEQQVRALLATGGQAQAVEQAPVLYVSKGQLDNHSDPDGPDSANAGRYLPCRITPAGKFTTPLFAAPQAQAVEVDDHMALAFHHANTDGAIGQDDLNEIKIGLRAVLANLHAPQAQADARDAGLGTARAFIEWVKAQPEDREQTTIDGALVEFEAHIAAIAAAKGEAQ